MKIIYNTFNEKEQKFEENEITCPHCKSILRISEEDFSEGEYGACYILCPCCHKKIEDDKFPYFDVTRYTVSFPKSYHSFKDGVDIEDEEINKMVDECIRVFEEYPEETFRYHAVGNTFVAVFNHVEEDDYYVVVTKNYFDTYVDKEK